MTSALRAGLRIMDIDYTFDKETIMVDLGKRCPAFKAIVCMSMAAVAVTAFGLVIAGAQGGKQRATPVCKITPIEAMKIATGKLPGTALNANFEFAEGHWVYAVFVV